MRVVFGVVLLACLVAVSSAHTVVKNVTIGGVTTTSCLRPAYQGYDSVNGIGADTPIMSSTGLRDGLLSQNYTCGFMPFAANAAASSCSIAAGQSIGVSYYHGAGYGTETPAKDMWIASSHRGPFLAYMARWDQATGIPTDARWFKIYHSGVVKNAVNGDYSTREWASPDTLNRNGGRFTFPIPSDLAPGRYLLRTEIIALHDTSARGAQPYVRCIDLTVTGTGTANPPNKVALPGAIGYTDPGLTFNVYTSNDNYPIPGPPVYVPGTATSTTGSAPVTTGAAPATTAAPSATTGVVPATTGVQTTAATPGIGDCLAKSTTRKGCSNQCVSDCVCDVDPYCCRFNWDPWCVREVTRFGCATECNVIVNQEIPDDTSYVRDESGINSAAVAGASVVLAAVAVAALL